MPKVALIQVVYNSRRFMPAVIPAALHQTERDCRFYAVIAGNDDYGREYLEQNFPDVEIIDPEYNVGFSRGHNLVFSQVDAKYFQLINPDLIISPNFVEKMLLPFEHSKSVAAVGGKLLQYNFGLGVPGKLIDSTGVTICRSGRAFDRGQHEEDQGQYDHLTELMAVSGAAAMFRRDALEDVAERNSGVITDYFDEDFHAYFEDVDLCWRLYNRGWKIRYQPEAIAWHGRAVPSSQKGFFKIRSFIRHRKSIPLEIRQMSYKNHLLMFLKNSPRLYVRFVLRELIYNFYILLTEPSVLKVWPRLWKQLLELRPKRSRLERRRLLSIDEAERLIQ